MVETRIAKTGQQGFTLIEIIAVLVILGILAVVAVPKYYDLQDQARLSAAQGLVAAAQSQLSMAYSLHKLNSSDTNVAASPQAECLKVNVSGGTAGGNVSCTGGSWNVDSTITANVSGGGDVTGYWNNPEASGS